MSQKIVIVDYSMGNLNSVQKKLIQLNANVVISSDPIVIAHADKLILPGVGHFEKAIEIMHQKGLWDVLNKSILIDKKPILGICLGMQLMTKFSEEGNVNGLGWIDATVVRFQVQDSLKFKIPHMGWNQIEIKKESLLMNGLTNQSEFYFVHSYHVKTDDKTIVLNETNYETNFVSAFEKEHIFGVQYHPEKSHDSGKLLLNNFLGI
jgi:imidazole glycerol-phosphate synthase subunit HisH